MLTTERMAEIAKLAIRLQQISSCAAVTSSGETVLHHTHVGEILSALHDVTSELLANREAQPVIAAWQHKGEPWRIILDRDIEEVRKHSGSWNPLYTAPPTPAVPDAISTRQAIDNMESHGPCDSINVAYKHGWNACRAAMLAQPVSQRYTLPPHLYRELVNSLRDTAVKFSGTEQLRERLNTTLHQFIEPDHPHTRTAAPEGGN